ncbi:phosphopentomutase [Cohaesibacter celericrescens]|uniref:Phosphopentomutase n=1 Tax=Cohaesibacter celericrescens TaxID=2067669 RepID=A0A2N5XMX0_9HYPH|nr:phosphopentomutase [Cohaesibacter celericrescens]PLW75843.1 phosphopentomutase [Cohaesibacter celericrescens]
MARAFLLVLDSFGIGNAPDAEQYGKPTSDKGSDTLGHIAQYCASGKGDRDGLRSGPLCLPNMDRYGLGLVAEKATGSRPANLTCQGEPQGLCANALEVSKGKDTPSGHWEIAGVPVSFEWGYFPDTEPTFPAELTQAFIKAADLKGIIGDKHASGTVIINELGEEHIRSGMPICYTSSDSVYQIAAHEEHFGLERLYEICEIAYELVKPYNIGRIIARPFVGNSPADFERTGNRRDFSVLPPEPTLLDRAKDAGRQVLAVGKISDIFATQGVTKKIKATGNPAIFEATLKAIAEARDGDLVFANLVDFDMHYGHRRDVPGYAAALEYFDGRIPELEEALEPGDLVILTADHGCDPTWQGTDHTREQVPVIMFGPDIKGRYAGQLSTFADIGETIADHLGLVAGKYGKSIL